MKLSVIRVVIAVIALWGGAFGEAALAARAPKKPAAKASSSSKPASAKPASKKTSAKPAAKRRTVSRSRRRGRRPRRAFVPRQAQPSKERFTEIQLALREKGYLTSDPSGEWNAESVNALKMFQEDQSLKATGKINALSLIALGLGPKRQPMGALPVIAPAPIAGPAAEPPEDTEEGGEIEAPTVPEAVPQQQ